MRFQSNSQGTFRNFQSSLGHFLAHLLETTAPSFVPKTTKIVTAALNATALIDGGHSAPHSGGDPSNDHNPKIPGGINMNVLSPQQRAMIDEAVAAANASDLAIAVRLEFACLDLVWTLEY